MTDFFMVNSPFVKKTARKWPTAKTDFVGRDRVFPSRRRRTSDAFPLWGYLANSKFFSIGPAPGSTTSFNSLFLLYLSGMYWTN